MNYLQRLLPRLLALLIVCEAGRPLVFAEGPPPQNPGENREPALSPERIAETRALLSQLGHEEYAVREAAQQRLIEIGPGVLRYVPESATVGEPEHQFRLAELKRVLSSRMLRDTAELTGHSARVLTVRFSPSGTLLASAGGGVSSAETQQPSAESGAAHDFSIRMWDVAARRTRYELLGATGPVTSVAWSRNEQQLLCASDDGLVRLWSLDPPKLFREMHTPGDPLCFVTFLRNEQYVLAAGRSGQLRVWHVESGKLVSSLQALTDPLVACAISPDEKFVAVVGKGNSARLLDLHSGELVRTLASAGESCSRLAFSPNGDRLAVGTESGAVSWWHVATGKFVQPQIRLAGGGVQCLEWSPDTRYLMVAGDADHSLRVIDTATSATVRLFGGHRAAVHAVTFAAGGRGIASGSDDRTVRLWPTVGLFVHE
jgi:WD40 repeat protein